MQNSNTLASYLPTFYCSNILQSTSQMVSYWKIDLCKKTSNLHLICHTVNIIK